MALSGFSLRNTLREIWGFILWGALIFTAPLWAQTDVANFRVPDINENGVMVSMLSGEQARMFPNKPMQITRLAIEFYEPDGKTVKMKILSPFCNYDTRTGVATSEEAITIESPQLTVTGKGYIFEAENSRVKIESQVKVLLRNLNLKTSQTSKDSNDE